MNSTLLEKAALSMGASHAALIHVKGIVFNADFRKSCEMNRCGKYGRNWMCPPDIGNVNDLIQEAKSYPQGLVYQSIYNIEDSFDIEGMLASAEKHNRMAVLLRSEFSKIGFSRFLNLNAGGCSICSRCAKLDHRPCIHPDMVSPSISAYGIDVERLAAAAGLKYVNGKNTVTYFSLFLYDLPENKTLIKISENGTERIFAVLKNSLISNALIRLNYGLSMPCGGHARCGKCRVVASGGLSPLSDQEKSLLSEEEIKDGFRLACSTKVLDECSVSLSDTRSKDVILMDGVVPEFVKKPDFTEYGLAFDIGTTTLAAQLFCRDQLVGTASRRNPQCAFGADVITRIGRSIHGEQKILAHCIREEIVRIIEELCGKVNCRPEQLQKAVITGNTAMLYLLTARNPDCLSHAPFLADCLFGEWLSGTTLGLAEINPALENVRIYLPHSISSFIGADITTAILASGITKNPETALLADIGTNGEIVLKHDDTLFCCSTAAGPAFEGAGLQMGMMGTAGAIDHVSIQNGKISFSVIGKVPDAGICGSGVVDALSVFAQAGLIQSSGRIVPSSEKFMDYLTTFESKPALKLGEKVLITQQDVRKVQLAKSAIYAGIQTLAFHSQISFAQIQSFYLAGGFGSFLDIHQAGAIGLIPDELISKTKVLGNAALTGAAMLLLNEDLIPLTGEYARNSVTIDLTTDPDFVDNYMNGMSFPSAAGNDPVKKKADSDG